MSRFLMDCSLRPSSWAVGVALLLLAAPVARVQAQQPAAAVNAAPVGNVENGKRSFSTYACSSCHGYSGHGGVEAGAPRLATTPMSLAGFASYVRQANGSSMPRFAAEILPDMVLADIYAFLKSIPPPLDPENIPLLNLNEQ